MSAMDLQQRSWQYALRRIAFALVLATAACALPMRPAIAQDRDGHDRQAQSDRAHRDDRDNQHDRRYQDQRRAPRYRYHQYPVYVPPPVYYPRHASPGITLFFPIETR